MKAAIGILGGTFDPIHRGHLQPALQAMQTLGLVQIRLMPNHIPPHRPQPIASAEQRLAMVRLAAENHPGFVVDDRELQRHTPSYTIDTLIELRKELPDTPLGFLIGMDSLLSLPTWHRWQELCDYAHLIVSVRPGWEAQFSEPLASFVASHRLADNNQIHHQLAGGVLLLENDPVAISASQLRLELASGIISTEWLPDAVAEYIAQEQIYRPNMV